MDFLKLLKDKINLFQGEKEPTSFNGKFLELVQKMILFEPDERRSASAMLLMVTKRFTEVDKVVDSISLKKTAVKRSASSSSSFDMSDL